jgi:uncharacterized membrane protein YeiH
MLSLLDLFGVAVFAASGALMAGRKRMDLFGVVVLAVVTAVGGGTLRDVLLGITPVFWVRDPLPIVVALGAALATVAAARRWRLERPALLVADAFGLALFTVLGAEHALHAGTPAVVALIMGVMSGVAGGIVRDLLCSEVPLILRREIYATAALLGAAVFVGLCWLGVGRPLAITAGMGAGLTLRLAAIRWSFSLPVFSLHDTHDP